MREVKFVNSFSGFMSHGRFIKHAYKFHDLPLISMRRYHNIRHSMSRNSIMSPTIAGEEQWTAVRVRETFLDYFKKNGHTFGEINGDTRIHI